jgi:beta-glucosidase
VTAADSTPVRPFGFGLGYSPFEYSGFEVDREIAAGGLLTARVTVTNNGARAGADVIQVYGHDLQGSIARPVAQLLAYARVELPGGGSSRIEFSIPSGRFAFTDRHMRKIVEQGDVEVWIGSHAAASASADPGDAGTGTAIVSRRPAAGRDIPGHATDRARVSVRGPSHVVTLADARQATWSASGVSRRSAEIVGSNVAG